MDVRQTRHPFPRRDVRSTEIENCDPDVGFTLIELLIVIVILGVLAAVVVFAVGGITSRGEVAAAEADETTLVVAQEAHMAQFGTYATEAELVTIGLLRDESTLWDVEVDPGGASYSIGAVGSFTPPPPPSPTTTIASGPTPPAGPSPATFGGHGGQSLGSGSSNLVIIGTSAQISTLWANLLSGLPADTTVTWLDQGDVTTTGQVDAIFASADYVVPADNFRLTGSPGQPFVGAYLSGIHSWPAEFWWTFQLGIPTVGDLESHL